MKTTIDIADSLLREAKIISSRENTTVRALVEEGLRESLKKHKTAKSFKLRKAAFKGQGLQAEFSSGQWAAIRAAVYEGRGG